MNDDHGGYGGEPGTYLMQEGLRVRVDPETLKPQDEPVAEQAPEKTKPAAEPAKKAASDANLTE